MTARIGVTRFVNPHAPQHKAKRHDNGQIARTRNISRDLFVGKAGAVALPPPPYRPNNRHRAHNDRKSKGFEPGLGIKKIPNNGTRVKN